MRDEWECVVVGGGAAGLSAALVLGRARRRTLVVDAESPSNLSASVIGGLLGFDQRPPAELYEAGRRELSAYPTVEYRVGEVVGGTPTDDRWELDLDDGQRVRAQRVLLATGMQYCPPDLPGLTALWGKSVFQCPFCHGWEMRDKRLAALATGGDAVHAALMLRGWSDDVVALTDGPSRLGAEQVRLLDFAGVAVDERRLVELIGEAGQLAEIGFADGTRIERDGLLVQAPLRQRSALAEGLGAGYRPGPMAADSIGVDASRLCTTIIAAFEPAAIAPATCGCSVQTSPAAKTEGTLVRNNPDEFGLPYPPI